MQRILKLNSIPEQSIISKDFGRIDYCDSFKVTIRTDNSIDSILTIIFRTPTWVDYLVLVRNFVVKIFGLKTESNKNIKVANYYPVGAKAVYFTVIDRNDNEIVMAEDDLHLYFRTSVMVDRKRTHSIIYLTTLVRFHSIWGRIYFLPVKPFHRIIIKSIMKQLLKN
ncbi:MAG: DUF2867 domain-containing protein [Bacteroidales bacterium]|nr:MAG: DUF2867 domain-containing protein [Bacteroidales bacterium]